MQVVIEIKGIKPIEQMLAVYPKQASRALEQSLDQTAAAIKVAEVGEIRAVFTSPVPYTLNSLKVTRTKGHNMVAKVGFKEPPRMQQHYLVPEVEGGPRKLKGIELATESGKEFDLAVGAKRTGKGNITVAQAKGMVAGIKRGGDYFYLPRQHGKLLPGVYQRIKSSRGLSRAESRKASRLLQQGRKRGRYVSAIAARGIKPIIIQRTSKQQYKPAIKFYEVAQRVVDQQLLRTFYANLDRLIGR